MKDLVILAPNWLGDGVMAQPAITDLRRGLPDAMIAVAVKGPAIASLFGMVNAVDEVVSFDELRGRGFEAALLLPNSFHAALVAYRAGIPERWGYRTDWRSPLLTRAIDRASGVHQAASYQQLVHALGFPNGPVEPRVTVSDAMRSAGADELRRAGWNGHDPLVALAPGAAYGAAKRWPPASFVELARSLAADGIRPVLVGGAADADTGREILRGLARGILVLNTIGNDIPGLAGVLVNCRALVSNDSGAMHLGAAIGVSVTALFGPTDERLTRPLGDRHTVLTYPVWCRPCMLRECPLDHRCLRGTAVETVADATRRMLNASY
jgi:lipopolysaccharide heptosyltransferase II